MNYIWGKGKSITETTMEFEIEKMYILIPGQGSHTISAIEPAGPDTIFVKLFYIGDEKKEHPIRMKFHFLDINTFWIECPEWNEMFIVGNDKPWYRLSGPQRK
jgi:hypothetical protein